MDDSMSTWGELLSTFLWFSCYYYYCTCTHSHIVSQYCFLWVCMCVHSLALARASRHWRWRESWRKKIAASCHSRLCFYCNLHREKRQTKSQWTPKRKFNAFQIHKFVQQSKDKSHADNDVCVLIGFSLDD